jgi:hypothetical protein
VHDRIGVIDAALAFDVFVRVDLDPVRLDLAVAPCDDHVAGEGRQSLVDVVAPLLGSISIPPPDFDVLLAFRLLFRRRRCLR